MIQRGTSLFGYFFICLSPMCHQTRKMKKKFCQSAYVKLHDSGAPTQFVLGVPPCDANVRGTDLLFLRPTNRSYLWQSTMLP